MEASEVESGVTGRLVEKRITWLKEAKVNKSEQANRSKCLLLMCSAPRLKQTTKFFGQLIKQRLLLGCTNRSDVEKVIEMRGLNLLMCVRYGLVCGIYFLLIRIS